MEEACCCQGITLPSVAGRIQCSFNLNHDMADVIFVPLQLKNGGFFEQSFTAIVPLLIAIFNFRLGRR